MKLTIKDKSGAVRIAELTPQAQPCTIGRAPDCNVTLESPQVSSLHARLQLDSRGLTIRDAGSINGVYIAGKRIGSRACPLAAGQEFTIADYTLAVSEFDGAAAPPRRRPTLLPAVLLGLLILALAAWLAARRSAPAAPPPATPSDALPAVPDSLPPVALPVVSTQQQAQLDQAGSLINQGERALYERNDYVGAARLFNAALADNPNDVRAGSYLGLVRTRALPELLQRGEECLRLGNTAGARAALQDLEIVAPGNDDVKFFRRILDGMQQFQQAQALAGRGEWEAAVKILETIVIPDDGNRVAFLEAARRQVGWRHDFRQADDCLQRREYPAALAGLQRIMAQADADPRLLREVQDRSRLVEQVMLVQSAAAASNRYAAAISAGSTLLASAALRQFPSVQQDLQQALDNLHARLLPQRAAFAGRLAGGQAELAAAEEAGRLFAAAAAGRAILDNAIVLDFLDGQTAPSPEREQLRRRIRNYARQAFQRGYVLKEQNLYAEALESFRQVVELAEPYDELAGRARAQCAVVQNLLSARPQAAAAARAGLNTAPAPTVQP